jgi:hypothetical protein
MICLMPQEEATRRGQALLEKVKGDGWRLGLEKVKGDGWRLDVWENVGWHFAVRNGPFSICPIRGGEAYYLTGPPKYSPAGPSEDPNELMGAVIEKVRESVRQEVAFLDHVESLFSAHQEA